MNTQTLTIPAGAPVEIDAWNDGRWTLYGEHLGPVGTGEWSALARVLAFADGHEMHVGYSRLRPAEDDGRLYGVLYRYTDSPDLWVQLCGTLAEAMTARRANGGHIVWADATSTPCACCREWYSIGADEYALPWNVTRESR